MEQKLLETFLGPDHQSFNGAQRCLTEDGDDEDERSRVGGACVCARVSVGYWSEMTLIFLLMLNIIL